MIRRIGLKTMEISLLRILNKENSRQFCRDFLYFQIIFLYFCNMVNNTIPNMPQEIISPIPIVAIKKGMPPGIP